MNGPAVTLADALISEDDALGYCTVIRASRGRATVELANGQVVPSARLQGGASKGDLLRVSWQGGEYVVMGGESRSSGDTASGGGGGGAVIVVQGGGGTVTGAPSPHPVFSAHHTWPSFAPTQFLAGPVGGAGTPVIRTIVEADIAGAGDARYARTTVTISADAGLTGGGTLASSTINLAVGQGLGIQVNANDVAVKPGTGIIVDAGGVNVNQGHPFAWTAAQTWTQPLRAVGGSGGYEAEDRTTSAPGNRWSWYANTTAITALRWAYGGSEKIWMTSGAQIRSPNYVSQTTGLLTDYATGEVDARYVYTDQLRAKAFIADLEQALAGLQLITKSVTQLHTAFTAPALGATAPLTVKDLPSAAGMRVFENGDFILIRQFSRAAGSLTITNCWGTVTLDTTYGVSGFDSASGSQRYTFTRSTGTDGGAMSAGAVVNKDAIILDFGVSGNGVAEVNAVDGLYGANAPYYRIANWSTHPSQLVERWRAGNLRGVTGVAGEWGTLASTGGIANTASFIRLSSAAAQLQNISLDVYSAGTRVFRIDHAQRWQGLGNPAPTSYLGSTGWWVGDGGGGVYKFHVGTVAGGALTAGLSWDGATLTVKGVVNITSGSGYAQLSDKPTSLSTINGTEGSKLAGIAAGATVGAVWSGTGANLSGIPVRFSDTPSGAGLYLGSSQMGYYSGSQWQTYMDAAGGALFRQAPSETVNSGSIWWDGTRLRGGYWQPAQNIQSVANEVVTTPGAYPVTLSLAHTRLVSGTVVLTNTAGTTTYTLGTHYTVNLAAGTITIPAGSPIPLNSSAHRIDYNWIAGPAYGNFVTQWYADSINGSLVSNNAGMTIDATGITLARTSYGAPTFAAAYKMRDSTGAVGSYIYSSGITDVAGGASDGLVIAANPAGLTGNLQGVIQLVAQNLASSRFTVLNIESGGGSVPSRVVISGNGTQELYGPNAHARLAQWSPFYSPWGTFAQGDGGAAIVNDAGTYKALMIVGNSSANGSTRVVKVWDRLDVDSEIGLTWSALTFYNDGTTVYSSLNDGTYQPGRYKKFGDMVFLEGVCRRVSGTGLSIAQLPAGFRPVMRQIFYTIGGAASAGLRIDVRNDGWIVATSGIGSPDSYFSLSGIHFSVK